MFELIVTVCILGDPAQCMDRRLPTPVEPAPVGRCLWDGHYRAQMWADAHPDLELRKWRCVGPQMAAMTAPAPFDLAEVAPGVFVHRGRHETPTPDNAGDLANTGFVIGEDSVAVIDAGGSAQVARALLGAVREHTDLPVSHLILTHMHPDHTLGAGVFAAEGATVVGHAKLPRALTTRAETYRDNIRRLIGEKAYEGSGVVLPGQTVEDTQEIDLGGRVLRLTAYPTAHTDNDITVFDEASGTLFAGDLVFAGHLPALDGSITGWLKVLSGLAETGAKRIVPGHGPAVLDLPEGLAPITAYLEALAAQTRAAIASGATMTEAMRSVGEDQREGWELFDEFHRRNVTAAYKELEWE